MIINNPKLNYLHEEQLEFLQDKLEQLNFNSVLELGAGWGRITEFMNKNFKIDDNGFRLYVDLGYNTLFHAFLHPLPQLPEFHLHLFFLEVLHLYYHLIFLE